MYSNNRMLCETIVGILITYSYLCALLVSVCFLQRGFQLYSIHHLLLYEAGPQSSSTEEPDSHTQHEDENNRNRICRGE